ncbi:MAG: hypothetical protein AAF726_18465 [Planctomycetota bacterium]
MPTNKDLKKLVRYRMEKTGESYATARMHVLGSKPIPKDYLELTGMSDEAVAKKTGMTWPQWVAELDKVGAAGMLHREIAKHVDSNWPVGGWWAQTVTVGYERVRGLRDVGQRRFGKEGGTYDANKSKTYPVPVAELYKAFATKRVRERFLPGIEMTIRTSTKDKSMRISWPGETSVHLYFTDKGPAKSQVQVQQVGLASKADAETAKGEWHERLKSLGELLGS